MTGAPPGRRAAVAKRLAHLPFLLTVAGVTLVVATVVGAIARGAAGAAGAAAGVALVAVSFLISTIVIAYVDATHRERLLIAGVGTYIVKFTVLGFVMAAVARTGWAGLGPLALGVVAGVIAWTGAQVWWHMHAKIPYVDLDD